MGLASRITGFGVGMGFWGWHGVGMGLAWGWHGAAWGWHGVGMGLAWGWHGVFYQLGNWGALSASIGPLIGAISPSIKSVD
jgi:hypothetical protein